MKRVSSSGAQGFIVAVVIHAVGMTALFVISPPERARASYRPPVKVRLATRPEPPPPKATEAKPPAPEPEKPIVVEPKKPLKKRVASVKQIKTPKAEPVAPAVAPPAAPAKPSTPRKFTVAMEATVSGGGVAVPASSGGGWSFGAPDGDAKAEKVLAGPAPPKIEEKRTEAAVEAAGVTRLPRLLSQPSLADMRRTYPEEARRNGQEANVYLKILIDAQGRVSKVRVIRSAGAKFDRAARDLVKRFRFRPGEVDGRPREVWIPWTYKFRLEG